MTPQRKTLEKGEPHPAAVNAVVYLNELDAPTMERIRDTIRLGIEQKNRLAEICGETLEKMDQGLPATDTELLGLAFTILNV